jgi:hypothetical protein
MRRAAVLTVLVIGALTLFAGLGSGTAAAGAKKLVEGTVYNTSCGAACTPCPPPCGPVPTPQSRSDIVCAQQQKRIVCPLTQADRRAVAPDFCIQGQPCGVDYPVYSGEGAQVTIRKKGTTSILATLAVIEGHFKIRLAPGEYVIRPYLPPEEKCLSGVPTSVRVEPKMKSPVPASIDLGNVCVVHPDAAR